MNYSTKYFFLTFIGLLLLLFFLELLSISQQNIIIPWTQFLATVSSHIVSLFDSHAISHGVVLQDSQSGFAVSIQPGCNGIEAAIVLIAAMVAFPATWSNKLKGIVVGFIAIQALNVVRIISLFYLGQWNMVWFEWAHLYIWQALIMLDVLIVFVLWIKFINKSSSESGQQNTQVEV